MDISRPSSGYGHLTPTYDDPSSTGNLSSADARAQQAPAALAGDAAGQAVHGRNKRDEIDGTFRGNRPGANSGSACSGPPGAPDASADAYATFVMNSGIRSPLSDAQLTSLRQDVLRSIDYSQGRLADEHTADLLCDTVLGALGASPTFRAAVSYGLNNRQLNLGDITYSNEYESNYHPNGSATPLPIGQLTLGIVQHSDAQTPAAFPHGWAIRGPLGYPYISVGAAPNSDSPYLPSWREGLIHETIHQVTGSQDHQESEINRLSPTELIARRVADEMGWHFPAFRGYADPYRIAYLRERNQAALIVN